MNEVNPRTFTGTLSLCKISPLSGYNLISVRTRIRRRQKETEWQEQGAREAVWKLSKSVLKLKEHERATDNSLEFGKSFKDLLWNQRTSTLYRSEPNGIAERAKRRVKEGTSAVLSSCSPTIVITANGEVQTHEEAIVYVKELDVFLTVKVLENTPAVLSLGKHCDENGYSNECVNGQKTHLIKNGIHKTLQ